MRKHTKILARAVVLATVAAFAGCNGHIDEEPNVVLEVTTLTIPPVTGAFDSTSNTCVFTITNANATLKNLPKNHLAGDQPFNDVVLQDVTVNYVWDDGAGVTGPVVFGLGGTVPANSSGTAQFTVINGRDVVTPSREGHTASLTMTFRGVTIAGENVSTSTGGTLTVNTCQ